MSGTPLRAWVGCLACYNEGRLVGEWYDADEAADIEIEQVHKDGEAPDSRWLAEHEELWVFDHEGFGALLKGECSPYEAQRVADLIDDLDDDLRDAVRAYLDDHGDELDDQSIDRCRSAYHGKHDDEEDFARRWAEDADMVSDDVVWPYNHIDWDAATKELFNGAFSAEKAYGGGIHVFCSE